MNQNRKGIRNNVFQRRFCDYSRFYKSYFKKATTLYLKLPRESKQALLKILADKNLNNLDSNYIKTIDDGTTFTFTVLFKNKSKKITVHYVKVPELFSITQVLDSLLPFEFKIGYNKSI